MRVTVEGPFHVNCPHTSRSICYCLDGTPPSLRDPAAAATYYQNAQQLHEYVSHPTSSLYGADTVEVLVPRLLRRERTVTYPPAAPSGPFPTVATANESSLGIYNNLFLEERPLACSTLVPQPNPAGGGAAPSMPSVLPPVLPSNPFPHSQYDMMAAPSPMCVLPQDGFLIKQHEDLEEPKVSQMLSGAEFDALRRQATPSETGSGNPTAPVLDVPALQSIQDSVKAALQDIARSTPGFPKGYSARGPKKRAPPKTWHLAICDVRPALVGKMVQILWPEDKQWWPAAVLEVAVNQGTATLMYETGEKEEGVALVKLIQAGQVAWMDGPETLSSQGATGKRARRGSPVVVDPPTRTRPVRARRNSVKRQYSPSFEDTEHETSGQTHGDIQDTSKVHPATTAGSQDKHHHQQDMPLVSPAPLPVPGKGSLVVPYLMSLGGHAAGLDVMLSVQGRWLPTKVANVNPQEQTIILHVGNRSVVLKGSDEGSRYTLFLV